MKSLFKFTKIKLIALILAVSALALAAGKTVAFFTDTQEIEGVFTAGNVYIELSEAAVKSDDMGNLVEDTAADRIKGATVDSDTPVIRNYGHIFPGQKIFKDPTIKNVGDESAWVAAKVIITDGRGDIHPLLCFNDASDDIDIESLFSGGLLDEQVHVSDWNGFENVCFNDNYAMVQISDADAGVYEFYFFMLRPIEKNKEIEIFNTLIINSYFGNDEMQQFIDFNVTVQAFAVQTFGFSSCLDAMKGAFETHFEDFVLDTNQ